VRRGVPEPVLSVQPVQPVRAVRAGIEGVLHAVESRRLSRHSVRLPTGLPVRSLGPGRSRLNSRAALPELRSACQRDGRCARYRRRFVRRARSERRGVVPSLREEEKKERVGKRGHFVFIAAKMCSIYLPWTRRVWLCILNKRY